MRAFSCIIAAMLILAAAPAWGVNAGAGGGDFCAGHTRAAEAQHGIPVGLLQAIGLAESGYWDSQHRASRTWPWTVTSGPKSRRHPDRKSALAHVAELQAQGVTNIDVGCMQVNLGYHGHKFASVTQAMDPARNVAYAAEYLAQKRAAAKSWIEAAGHYHSTTPHLAARYRSKVVRLWGVTGGQKPKTQTAARTRNLPAPANTGATAGAPAGATAGTPSLTPIDHARTAQLNNAFRARRSVERALAGGGGMQAVRTDSLAAWRAARQTAGAGAGALAGLKAVKAGRAAAAMRRAQVQAAERAQLRGENGAGITFTQKRRADLEFWRKRNTWGR
ncbi:MAG: lysozyme family protein [Rhodospirillales bacterium]